MRSLTSAPSWPSLRPRPLAKIGPNGGGIGAYGLDSLTDEHLSARKDIRPEADVKVVRHIDPRNAGKVAGVCHRGLRVDGLVLAWSQTARNLKSKLHAHAVTQPTHTVARRPSEPPGWRELSGARLQSFDLGWQSRGDQSAIGSIRLGPSFLGEPTAFDTG